MKNKDLKDKKELKDQKDDKNQEENKKGDNNYADEDDEFNVSLAAMEEEIKPKIITLVQSLSKNYSKLKKYQIEKLNCILNRKELSVSKNKNYTVDTLSAPCTKVHFALKVHFELKVHFVLW